jgi:hypothetical protein
MASYKNSYNQAIANRQHALNVANLKNDYAESLIQPLHGGAYQGGDFWSDFGDGFMSVMKPVGQVLSAVAPFIGAGEGQINGGDMSVNAPYIGYKYGDGLSGGNIANGGIPPFNIPTNAGMSGGGISGGEMERKIGGAKMRAPLFRGLGLSGGDEVSDTDHPLLLNPELQATMFLGGRRPNSVSKAVKKRMVQKAIADMLLQRQLMAVHGKGLSGGGMSGGDFDWSSLLSFAPLLLGLGLSGGGESGGAVYDDLSEFEPLLTGLGMSGGDFWSDISKPFVDGWNWVSGTAVPFVVDNADKIGKVVDLGSKISKLGAGQSGGMYDKSKYGNGQSGGMTYQQNMDMADAMGDIFSGMGQSGGGQSGGGQSGGSWALARLLAPELSIPYDLATGKNPLTGENWGSGKASDTRMNSGKLQLYKGGALALNQDALKTDGNVNQPYVAGGLSGGDFWSDLGTVASQVAPFLPLLGLGESGGGVSGGKKKAKKQTKQDKMNERLAMKIAHLQGKGLESTSDMEASNKIVGLMAKNNPMVDGAGVSGGKKTSKWIAHVKAYAKQHGIKYGDALKQAKSTYRG